jgi:hypothetical protein
MNLPAKIRKTIKLSILFVIFLSSMIELYKISQKIDNYYNYFVTLQRRRYVCIFKSATINSQINKPKRVVFL